MDDAMVQQMVGRVLEAVADPDQGEIPRALVAVELGAQQARIVVADMAGFGHIHVHVRGRRSPAVDQDRNLDRQLVPRADRQPEHPSRLLNVSLYGGETYPLHASATGKLLLAELSDDRASASLPRKLESFTPNAITSWDALLKELRQVREQGYAILDNELDEGLFVVAFPVRDLTGRLMGIVSVNGPVQRLKWDQLAGTIDEWHKAAEEIVQVLS